jgi:hypothetical protein
MATQGRTNIWENAKKWMLNLFRVEAKIDSQEAMRLAIIFQYPECEDMTPEEQIEDLKYELKAALAQRDYMKSAGSTLIGVIAVLVFLGFVIGAFYPGVSAFLCVLFPPGILLFWKVIEQRASSSDVIPPYRVISRKEIQKDEQKQ